MVPIDYFFLNVLKETVRPSYIAKLEELCLHLPQVGKTINVLKETQTHPSSFACVIEVLLAMDAFPKQLSERSSSVWEVSQF